MTLKPTTKTFPKLNLRDWPHVYIEKGVPHLNGIDAKALSDFTRVVEEMGILEQTRSQNDKPPSNEGAGTKSGDGK